MSKHLSSELDELHRLVVSLASSVEESVRKSVVAVREHNARMAEEVIAGDDTIDALENRVHAECMRMIALRQPVARDLRRTVAVLMLSADLERAGDLATGVAEKSLELPRWAADSLPEGLIHMGELAAEALRAAVDSYVRLDAAVARKVILDDERINDLNDRIIAELTGRMKSSPDWVEPGLALFAMTRHLERIGDHATNIAEDVIFLVQGEVMRHHFPAPEVDRPVADGQGSGIQNP